MGANNEKYRIRGETSQEREKNRILMQSADRFLPHRLLSVIQTVHGTPTGYRALTPESYLRERPASGCLQEDLALECVSPLSAFLHDAVGAAGD